MCHQSPGAVEGWQDSWLSGFCEAYREAFLQSRRTLATREADHSFMNPKAFTFRDGQSHRSSIVF